MALFSPESLERRRIRPGDRLPAMGAGPWQQKGFCTHGCFSRSGAGHHPTRSTSKSTRCFSKLKVQPDELGSSTRDPQKMLSVLFQAVLKHTWRKMRGKTSKECIPVPLLSRGRAPRGGPTLVVAAKRMSHLFRGMCQSMASDIRDFPSLVR